ncbi:MAG: tetratricopeptide repeat protein [Desulfobacteraceae bacterium]|jgi:adenylate cyclase
MNEERPKRKLSGILSADAVGYSRLMQEDEASTIRTLEESKRLMSELIQQFKGRVVDAPGDNLLAEFGSVVDATECAVKIQEELKTKNAELPDNRKMEFRIGVNLGDVVEEADRIYGDGVNIAARIEGLAEPGGICISRTAYDHVKNKLVLGYEYLGEHSVKNIAEPVSVYRVLMEPEAAGKVIGEKRFLGRISRRASMAAIIILLIVAGGVIGWNIYLHQSKRIEPASLDKMAYPLPDKPSIAVLAFDNLSGDPEQEYFCDGIAEEIITALSKIPKIFVIARNSSFTYKGKSVKVQQVAEELGVRYVLEGSVRKAEDKVRITAQLIDAISGKHLWAERYDRKLEDIFALQEEITTKIITALQIKLSEGEQARVHAAGTKNLEAYLKVLQSMHYFRQINKDDNDLAKKLADEAVALDPQYAMAYRMLAATHWLDVFFGSSKSKKESLNQAFELAKKAIALDDTLAEAHGLLAWLYVMTGQHDKGIAEAERAIALAPNSINAQFAMGRVLRFSGRPEEAIGWHKKSIRYDPMPKTTTFFGLCHACWLAGRYEEAVAACKKSLLLSPKSTAGHAFLAVTYISMGRDDEAHAELQEIYKVNPNFSLERFANAMPHRNKSDRDKFLGALRKASRK